MFISIILDTEYMGMGERHKWFLKSLSHAMENDWLVITHEYLGKHYHEFAQACEERFYIEFEMRKLNDGEYEKISKGFIPDEIFETKEKELESRTEFLIFLFEERYLELEKCLIKIIDEERKKRHNARVEGIFNCLDCFESIKFLGKHYDCPVIPYVFSAVRKVHGYQQTLYMTSMDGNLFSSDDGIRRYKKFKNENCDKVIFSNRELLAIFGKKNNIPLLNLLNSEPVYEIGICADAYNVNPYVFLKFKYTDDDIYYECKKKYAKNEIRTRIHPMVYDSMGMGREQLKNDPVSFILSCKRLTSVQSQMLLKALLWNRTVYMKGNFLQFSFLCEKDIESVDKVDLAALNYYMIGFLIPSQLMFDIDYWNWRIKEEPSESDIFDKHLKYYLKYFDFDVSIIECKNEMIRFSYLLSKRRCGQELINYLLDGKIPRDINYDVLLSKLEYGKETADEYDVTCVNNYKAGKVYSSFAINCKETADFIRFYPFVDIGGSGKINYIRIDESCVLRNENFCYYSKINGYERCECLKLPPGKHIVEIEWEYSMERHQGR